jgi:hypothetical protein
MIRPVSALPWIFGWFGCWVMMRIANGDGLGVSRDECNLTRKRHAFFPAGSDWKLDLLLGTMPWLSLLGFKLFLWVINITGFWCIRLDDDPYLVGHESLHYCDQSRNACSGYDFSHEFGFVLGMKVRLEIVSSFRPRPPVVCWNLPNVKPWNSRISSNGQLKV